MRRVANCALLCLALIVLAHLVSTATAAAAPGRLGELSSRDDVLKWIDGYRKRPDPASVPIAMRVLSQRGILQDSDTAGVYVGFLAGVIGARPSEATAMVGKVLPALAEEDQWIVARAIAYSGLPDWKALLSKFAARMPTRRVMIDKYLDGTLAALDEVPLEQPKPALMDKMKSYFGASAPKHGALTFDSSPELLDTLWGMYFATGNYRPVSRIIAMLPWSKDNESVEKLTVGGMAKYTLVSNATRSRDLLAMLKRASQHQTKPVAAILGEVIEAAETMEGARVRKDALAAIEDLKAKGPGYKREVSLWGKVGEGALAVGCIAAAAAGQVELGIPCVIGGATSSAALSAWDGQK
ncbi:MAG TPA: hypothetical protein VG291_03255 [Xanthobacteraceae bacterium]|nr:hypothetical protein [Xanthobacteraceae bacterium]